MLDFIDRRLIESIVSILRCAIIWNNRTKQGINFFFGPIMHSASICMLIKDSLFRLPRVARESTQQ